MKVAFFIKTQFIPHRTYTHLLYIAQPVKAM
jgi:hypothetical protein